MLGPREERSGKMPRVPIADVETAPEASREVLARQRERLGVSLNIFGAMANAPVLLELYDTMEQLLRSRSSLDDATRQAIHLTVANVNACAYCEAAYTGAARNAGFGLDETVGIRQGVVTGDERLTALLAVCRQIAAHKGHVDDGAWQDALAAGWSERELLEAYADVVRTILTNYFNHMVATPLDLPSAPPLPQEPG
jgi:AhpD family alkylhydroperoxidase